MDSHFSNKSASSPFTPSSSSTPRTPYPSQRFVLTQTSNSPESSPARSSPYTPTPSLRRQPPTTLISKSKPIPLNRATPKNRQKAKDAAKVSLAVKAGVSRAVAVASSSVGGPDNQHTRLVQRIQAAGGIQKRRAQPLRRERCFADARRAALASENLRSAPLVEPRVRWQQPVSTAPVPQVILPGMRARGSQPPVKVAAGGDGGDTEPEDNENDGDTDVGEDDAAGVEDNRPHKAVKLSTDTTIRLEPPIAGRYPISGAAGRDRSRTQPSMSTTPQSTPKISPPTRGQGTGDALTQPPIVNNDQTNPWKPSKASTSATVSATAGSSPADGYGKTPPAETYSYHYTPSQRTADPATHNAVAQPISSFSVQNVPQTQSPAFTVPVTQAANNTPHVSSMQQPTVAQTSAACHSWGFSASSDSMDESEDYTCGPASLDTSGFAISNSQHQDWSHALPSTSFLNSPHLSHLDHSNPSYPIQQGTFSSLAQTSYHSQPSPCPSLSSSSSSDSYSGPHTPHDHLSPLPQQESLFCPLPSLFSGSPSIPEDFASVQYSQFSHNLPAQWDPSSVENSGACPSSQFDVYTPVHAQPQIAYYPTNPISLTSVGTTAWDSTTTQFPSSSITAPKEPHVPFIIEPCPAQTSWWAAIKDEWSKDAIARSKRHIIFPCLGGARMKPLVDSTRPQVYSFTPPRRTYHASHVEGKALSPSDPGYLGSEEDLKERLAIEKRIETLEAARKTRRAKKSRRRRTRSEGHQRSSQSSSNPKTPDGDAVPESGLVNSAKIPVLSQQDCLPHDTILEGSDKAKFGFGIDGLVDMMKWLWTHI